MAWLAVPGYAEHAHSEPLEMLVEGGALLAGLLAVATALLLQPLWRQREVHGGLLAGWAVAAVMACLESHYGQPGPLFCLAVLAGATLAAGTTAPASPEPAVRALGLGVTLAVLLSIVWEFRWTVDGRTGHAAPPLVEVLGRRRLETERTAKEWPAVERRAARMQEELGPLTDLWFVQAEAAARQGRTRDALALTLRQARTGPLLPGHLELCDRLRTWARKHQDQEAMAALDRARAHARDLILRGQALGWRGKDQAMVTWLEAWAARQDADHSSPSASSPSSP